MNIHSSRHTGTRLLFLLWLIAVTAIGWSPRVLEAGEVNGKVVLVRGSAVTIRLERPAPVRRGDRVELSFEAAGEVITVGSWQVSAVKDERTVEATLVEARAEPTIRLDAVIRLSAESGVATHTGETPAEPPPETPSEPPRHDLPEIRGRYAATRDFSDPGEPLACDKGKIVHGGKRLEMIARGSRKNAGQQCSVRISDGPLENLHASVRMQVESDDFLVSLFFGNRAAEGGRSASIVMLGGALEGSVLMSVGRMTASTSSRPSRGKEKKLSSSWIVAYDTGGKERAYRQLSQQSGFANPTPGTMEFIKTGTLCRLLWNGEEIGWWEMESSITGEIRLAYAQVGRKKGRAVFDQISVYRLELAPSP